MAPKGHNIFIVDSNNTDMMRNTFEAKKENEEKEYTFEEALNYIGFGKVHLAILLVSGVILMAVINETMGMMIISLASQCDLKLNSQQKGFLNSIGFLAIGIIFSSHLWGYLADTVGRRKVIIGTLFSLMFFSVGSCFTNNFWIFAGIRLCAGICISGPSATIYAYLGEFNNTKYRQVMISWASVFIGIGTTSIPMIAWMILPQNWSIPIYNDITFRPWRLVIILYSLPGLVGALCLLKLPESPKFLMSQGNEDEALKVLEWIDKKNSCKPVENFPIKKLKPEFDAEYLENLKTNRNCCAIIKSMWRQTVPLFKPPNLLRFSVCCIVQFGILFCSGGMGLWYPEIQNRMNIYNKTEELPICLVVNVTKTEKMTEISSTQECQDNVNNKVFIDSITLGLFYIVGYILLALIIHSVGRKLILGLVLLASGLFGISLNWVTNPYAIVGIFCLFVSFSGLCVSVVNGVVVDIIPTHLRGMAVCIALMMGRMGSVAGSNIIGSLLEIDCTATFYIFSGFIIICGMLTLILPS